VRRPPSHRIWLVLLALGVGLLVADLVALALHRSHTTVTVTVTAPPTTTTPAPTTPPTTTTTSTPTTTTTSAPPVPTPVAMSWDNAGAMVVHPGDVDPAWLGKAMRDAGFGWLALDLGEGSALAPPDPSWIARFRLASGLPVGGWSVLEDNPDQEAAAVVQLIGQAGLSFYIANAEQPYGYTDQSGTSGERYGRSARFVAAFRKSEPSLPGGVSSYCRADQHDLDWNSWAQAGFVFLPQAYVNNFGEAANPALCVSGAAKFFRKSQVHPTVGSFSGTLGFVPPSRLVQLLARDGTTGFSIYPAEVGMSAEDWQVYGAAITSMKLAAAVR
jgi:hypothetical protein